MERAKSKTRILRAATVVGILMLAAVPRLLQLDYFLMVDENLWYERSASFLQGLVSGDLEKTVQTGHPGVSTMWSGTIGLSLHYVRSGLPGESLAQFADRMTTMPATLSTLRLLRLPLALLSALSVTLAFVLGRRLLGLGPALAGAALIAFEPLFVAHSRVLHHDSPAADFSLLAVLSWLLFVKEGRRRYLLLAGAGMGLAIISKVSSVFLLGFGGLTLLPFLWQQRQHLWTGLRGVAAMWLTLVTVTSLVIVLAWPAIWVAPGRVWNTVFGFITHESGPHASGTFFMGRPVPDAGLLFYPVGLAYALTPLTLGGLLLALIGLGLAWNRYRRTSPSERTSEWQWVIGPLLYAVLFVVFMSLIKKKQERYVLPAVVIFDLVAGWGYCQLVNIGFQFLRLRSSIFNRQSSVSYAVLSLLLLAGQFAFAWPTAPYFSTFYNPLLGGAAKAQDVVLIGRGEGLEQAVRYVQAQSGEEVPQVASWYGTTVKVLFGDQVDVKDVSHPQYILGSDYVIFYINQLQRQLPKETILRYAQLGTPVYAAQLAGIDYAYVYQGRAISHPTDPFESQNRLAGKASLTGFDLMQTLAAGHQVSLRLFWVNDDLQSGEHFYVRLSDELEQDWGWGSCEPDPAFGESGEWQDDDIVESQCLLVVYPGTPPGDYLLRAGVIAEDGTVIGQVNFSEQEGTVRVTRPADYPTDEWVPVEHRLQTQLKDGLTLIGYDGTLAVHKPGEMIPLDLFWRSLREMDESYTIRLTLRGEGPGQYAGWEGIPVNGRYSTDSWQTGEVVRDPWSLKLPSSLPTGAYDLSLVVTDRNGSEIGRMVLGALSVEGREHAFTLTQPPTVTQQARLGEAIWFLGYDLQGAAAGERLMLGRDLGVVLTWRAEATPERNYAVFVQLLDAAGQVRAQHDGQPGDGILITTTWAPGEYVRDVHPLALPPDLPAGDYHLIIGMYVPESGERLPVFDQASQPVGDHLMLETQLHVP
jgi:hypothetical protein